jgi:tetratricopeptide (TPR) repeat protein
MSALFRQWLRAQHYVVDGNLPAGRAALEAVLARDPGHTEASLLLASVLLDQRHLREAAAELLRAAALPPGNPVLLTRLAHALFRLGESVAARACLDRPAIEQCDNGEALARAAQMHQLMNDHRRALSLMDRARDLGVDNPDFRYFRSLQLQFNGRIAEAEQELEACLRLGPTYGRASLALARMRKQDAAHNHLDYICTQLRRVTHGSEDHAALEFAQFKELDDLGHRDDAWSALVRGNAIMFERVDHDALREQRHFNALAAIATSDFVRGGSPQPGDGPRPVFIVGMPRSGTTLLERILSNHSMVATAGELADFPRQLRYAADVDGQALVDDRLLERAAGLDYDGIGRRYLAQSQWRAAGKPRYIDKLPPNFMLAGLIHRALPEATILHMRREPMDVCFSNWKALFGESYGYSYQLDALAAHYRAYVRLMRHWHAVMPGAILDVSYSELVDNPEGTTRRVLEFCRLPWEDGCCDVASNAAPVSTLSSAQVRQPIHRDSLQAWRRYESQLAPLRSRIGTGGA